MRLLYGNPLGWWLADRLLKRPLFSKLYGRLQSHEKSRKQIAPFIDRFQIPMEEYEQRDFKSFNDFFTRKFKPGLRPFTQNPSELAAFAEGRYLAVPEVGSDQTFPVKDAHLSAIIALGSEARAKPFLGGPLLIARLCPTDYHRFHFPDDGKILFHARIPGPLHSVNPLAVARQIDILTTNERQVSILETKNFGKLAYVEVGALFVGAIHQTHPQNEAFLRGGEKGYFEFGGSTVLLFGEPGRWKPDTDLLEQSRLGRETLIRLGERVGSR